MDKIIIIYLIGVLFTYMKYCGFISSILYKHSIVFNKKDKMQKYLVILAFSWLSWIMFIALSIDYLIHKDKYFFKLKL